MPNSPSRPFPSPPPWSAALGICGFSGAGKTTLLEAVLPELRRRGLAVAVVKHDVHQLEVDRPGKDSDRLFQAGADVFLHGGEHFCRMHDERHVSLHRQLAMLERYYDLVLVEGYKHTPLPKIWLTGADDAPPPPSVPGIIACWPRDDRRPARLLEFLDTWLPERQRQVPVWGCILIGGGSRRMGRPKHLLRHADGTTWLARLAGEMAPLVEGVVVSGSGTVPDSLANLIRLPDVPGGKGPLAGIIAAFRWQPTATWLVAACDLPDCHRRAMAWLLGQRRPGIWGIMPRTDRPQPLLAWYDFRTASLFEELVASGAPRPSLMADHPRIATPAVPADLAGAWRNCNTPADLPATTLSPARSSPNTVRS